ncbi:MAG: hypothetical protein NMNS02_12020 [Nitrosomonas sp.]|nr:MAG: hypothetical protein NMNS02_12020 [Nitrosomonas sp.]
MPDAAALLSIRPKHSTNLATTAPDISLPAMQYNGSAQKWPSNTLWILRVHAKNSNIPVSAGLGAWRIWSLGNGALKKGLLADDYDVNFSGLYSQIANDEPVRFLYSTVALSEIIDTFV